jgi:hypothetical protein
MDSTRPILLNLGQGVANDEWYGRGPGAKLSDYEEFVKGADIVSFDVYPVAGLEKPDSENYLWYVPKGVDRLVKWTRGSKAVWNCIECTRIGGGKKATPKQVRAEVWMALIHGSRGIVYFVHQFKPTENEHALLDDPEMLAEVTATNREVRSLAKVLNSSTVSGIAEVQSSSAEAPVDVMVKRDDKSLYVFSVGVRNSAATAKFTVKGLPDRARAEVIGESRIIRVAKGQFTDTFAPYEVHLYRINK